MDKDYKKIKNYIYNKPECIFIRRFFFIFILSYIFGAVIVSIDIERMLGSNKFLAYESNSIAINLAAGFVISKFFTLSKYTIVWLRDKLYNSSPIKYDVNEDHFETTQDYANCSAYLRHDILQHNLSRIINSANGDVFIFMTSAPGMGKTVFLQQFIAGLKEDNRAYHYEDKYDVLDGEYSLKLNDLENTSVVIFDNFDDLFLKIRDIKRLKCDFERILNSALNGGEKNKVVILSFSNECLSEVIQFTRDLQGKKELLIFEYEDQLLNEIEKKFSLGLGVDIYYFRDKINEISSNSKLKTAKMIMNDLRGGVLVTLAEISAIYRMLISETEETIRKWLSESIESIYNYREYIIRKYLAKIVKESNEAVVCLIIMYSCAKTAALRQKLIYTDLQNICNVDNSILLQAIKYLETKNLIKKDDIGIRNEERIVLVNKYWVSKILGIVKVMLDSSVIYNLDTYFEMKNEKEYFVDNSYERFHKGRTTLKRILCFALGLCFLLMVRNYLYCNSVMDYVFFALLSCLSGLTVFYNYNYVCHFLLPCKKEFYWNSVVSFLALMGSLYFYDYWFAFWGLGMMVQVISLVILDYRIFTKDILVFTMIGTLVSVLGYGLYLVCIYCLNGAYEAIVPIARIAGLAIVIAIMFGALARHILLTYLISNFMKVKNKKILLFK